MAARILTRHDVLSTASSSTSLLSDPPLPRCPVHCVLLHNLCNLRVSPHHDVLSTASSSTTSATSMSLLTTMSCPLRPPPQPLPPPCLSSPRCPVHCVLLHNLCHLHVSPHRDVLSTASSSTTSATSMFLLTTMSCPLRPPPQPLSPPCLSSPLCPVHCVLLHNLCHLHLSPHHDVLSTSPRCPVHCVLLHNLCHLHVSPHHDVLSTASSSTTSATSMSLLTTSLLRLRGGGFGEARPIYTSANTSDPHLRSTTEKPFQHHLTRLFEVMVYVTYS